MRRVVKPSITVLTLVAILLIPGCQEMARKRMLAEKIRNTIETLDEKAPVVQGQPIYQPEMIAKLYEGSGEPTAAKWSKLENINQLLTFIRNARLEGLDPEDYHRSSIENLLDRMGAAGEATVDDMAQLDLLLTDAFFLLSAHLAGGKTDQKTIDPNWNAAQRDLSIEWNRYIDSTLQITKVNETLHRLTPGHREYANLKKALARYLQFEARGGWKPFHTRLKKMEIGMNHPDVDSLRKRLAVTQGPIKPDSANANLFDQSLHNQVVEFQRHFGLTADGVVGKQCVEALNVPVGDRIAAIEANLERWRWLSDDLGERHILVNIANFDLQLIEQGKPVFVTEVIVGRPFRETPVFSSRLTYLVFNPDWTVPPTIQNDDVIPAMVANPNYLIEKKMKVITLNGQEVDPGSIDWNKASLTGFPYMIRQEPGANNALGRVKFMFPNEHNIYIHDTPSRGLFTRRERTFSSGCIRMNKPFELAQILLDGNPDWDPQKIKEVMEEGKPKSVRLTQPVPVHILYMTAWADDQGIPYFRKDVYNRDQPLLAALKKHHPVDR